jgi:hypothetical protein
MAGNFVIAVVTVQRSARTYHAVCAARAAAPENTALPGSCGARDRGKFVPATLVGMAKVLPLPEHAVIAGEKP